MTAESGISTADMERPGQGVILGGCVYHPARRCLVRDDRVVKLSPRTSVLLDVLVARAGHVVTREELTGAQTDGAPATANGIHKCMVELRQAFASLGEDFNVVETIPRRGYRLTLTVGRAAGVQDDGAATPEASSPIVSIPPAADDRTRTVAAVPSSVRRAVPRWLLVPGCVALALFCVVALLRCAAIAPRGAPHVGPLVPTVAPRPVARTRVVVAPVRVLGTDPRLSELALLIDRAVLASLGAMPGVEAVAHGRATAPDAGRDGFRVEMTLADVDGQDAVNLSVLDLPEQSVIQARRHVRPHADKDVLVARLVADLVGAAEILFDERQMDAMAAGGTRNTLAWRAWLDARSLRETSSVHALDVSIARMKHALTIDPTFWRARIELQGTLLERLRLETRAGQRVEIEGWLQQQDRDLADHPIHGVETCGIVAIDMRVNARSVRDAEAMLHAGFRSSMRCKHVGAFVVEYADVLVSAGLHREARELLGRAHTLLDDLPYPADQHRDEVAARSAPDALREAQLRSLLRRHPEHPVWLFDLVLLLLRQGSEDALPVIARLQDAAGDSDWHAVAAVLARHVHMRGRSTFADAAAPVPARRPFVEGLDCMLRGDIGCGAAAWREVDPGAYKELLGRMRDIERFLPPEVTTNTAYRGALEALGVGASWASRLRGRQLASEGAVQRLVTRAVAVRHTASN